jgi:hypothetical protein
MFLWARNPSGQRVGLEQPGALNATSVWARGSSLYPHERMNCSAVWHTVVDGAGVATGRGSLVPSLVSQVVHRCLQRDPARRFQSARHLT